MIEDKDYIMRLTHEIARTLIKLIFNRDIDKEDETPVSLERLQQFKKLTGYTLSEYRNTYGIRQFTP